MPCQTDAKPNHKSAVLIDHITKTCNLFMHIIYEISFHKTSEYFYFISNNFLDFYDFYHIGLRTTFLYPLVMRNTHANSTS